MRSIELTRGQRAVVDDEDYHVVAGRSWQAQPRRDGKGWYAVARGGVRMHRLIMGVSGGRIVDHANGDGLDNRRQNLRVGTQSQNCVNRKTTPGRYMRGTRKTRYGRWQATIKDGNKNKHLGCFATELEAHLAYVAAAKKIHGEWLPEPPNAELSLLPEAATTTHSSAP